MRSLSKVMLLGHLAADVDLRQTKTGRSVASFPVATNRAVKDESGKKREIADFHRVIAWAKLAEICSTYLIKGTAVLIQGRLVNRSYDDKNGNRNYRAEIIAEDLNILTSKKSRTGKSEIVVENPVESEMEEEAVAA